MQNWIVLEHLCIITLKQVLRLFCLMKAVFFLPSNPSVFSLLPLSQYFSQKEGCLGSCQIQTVSEVLVLYKVLTLCSEAAKLFPFRNSESTSLPRDMYCLSLQAFTFFTHLSLITLLYSLLSEFVPFLLSLLMHECHSSLLLF